MSTIRFGLPMAALIALPFTTQAQTLDTAPVVVTATKIAQTADQALVPVSIITREEIERSPASSLPELLRLQPGIDFSQSGGHGANASLFMRGTGSSHVLVLVDGARIGSVTLGQVAFQDLPLSQIERVEIVRGPRSSLYGSDAIGGVIQIFTRRGEDEFRTHAGVAYGTHDTRKLEAGLSAGNQDHRFNLNLGHLSTEGIDAKEGGNPDKDGYRNNSLSTRYRGQLTRDLTLDLSLLRADSAVDIDVSSATAKETTDNLQQVLNSRLSYAASDSLDIKFQASESRDESNEKTNGVPTGRFDTRIRQYELQGDRYLGELQILTLGVAHTDQQIESSNDYAKTERQTNAVFGQWQNRFGDLELLLGLRSDNHDSFGRQNTGNINGAYHLDERNKILASYGTAFHAPTFNDLYFPSSLFGAGNPDLEPEESRSFELGYEHRQQNQTWAVRAFRTRIDNLIAWACTANCGTANWVTTFEFWQPSNVQEAKINGLELEWQAQLNAWQLRTSASFLDARDGDTDKVLPNRAERTLQLDLNRDFGRLNAAVNLLAQDHRFSDAANNNRLPGYGITNLRLGYELAEHWTLSGQLNNAFDKDYATNGGFNTLGRTLMVGIDYGI